MKISPLRCLVSLLSLTAIASTSSPSFAQNIPPRHSSSIQVSQTTESSWQRMNPDREAETWDYILNSPLAIAALNQLAIEGFISPICKKMFYMNEELRPWQTLLRVKCREPQDISTAIAGDEMCIIFNRFEMTIESFEVERVSPETPSKIRLPD